MQHQDVIAHTARLAREAVLLKIVSQGGPSGVIPAHGSDANAFFSTDPYKGNKAKKGKGRRTRK